AEIAGAEAGKGDRSELPRAGRAHAGKVATRQPGDFLALRPRRVPDGRGGVNDEARGKLEARRNGRFSIVERAHLRGEAGEFGAGGGAQCAVHSAAGEKLTV